MAEEYPHDNHGIAVHVGDVLVGLPGRSHRYEVIGIDRLQGSLAVTVRCLFPVEPGWETRGISRYDLWQGYEVWAVDINNAGTEECP
jgi:hypothetical protein